MADHHVIEVHASTPFEPNIERVIVDESKVLVAASSTPMVETSTSNETGLFDTATGQPVYSRVLFDDTGNEVGRELFYYDPVTGDEIVTTTGFTGTQPQQDVEKAKMYDTLATGVVERLTEDTLYVDGAFDSVTYRDAANAAYTPAGIIAAKPQKVQMGQEDLAVTGAGIGFAAIPTAANSQGQNFPQHALVHVHVDSADNAAGIAYTTDGTNPAEAHEFERSEGQPIELDTHEEILNFRAAPLDASGDIAAAETIQITVEYNNIDEDKDDI